MCPGSTICVLILLYVLILLHLCLHATIFDLTLICICPHTTQLRALLGQFLFKGDSVDKPLEALSVSLYMLLCMLLYIPLYTTIDTAKVPV
jgi:hypothetical protein